MAPHPREEHVLGHKNEDFVSTTLFIGQNIHPDDLNPTT